MERLVKLEAHMGHVQKDVTELREDMKEVRDRLKGVEVRLDALPSKGFVWGTFGVASGVVVALLTAVTLFQHQIQAILSISTGP